MPGMGWNRDKLDPRDYMWSTPPSVLKELPTSLDLRDKMPPVLSQGDLGSCTANTKANAFAFHYMMQFGKIIRPSRLYQYYNTRVLEGTVESDSGASIRNTIKAGVDWGVTDEEDWPYDISRFKVRPPESCYIEGATRQVLEYYRVNQTAQEIMGALASGHLVLCGMLIYPQFNEAQGGWIALPDLRQQPLGGHSQLLCGYFESTGVGMYAISQNSWGTGHGDKGYLYIPFSYLTNQQISADFWAIKLIEGDIPVPPVPIPPVPIPPVPPQPEWQVGPGVLKLMAQLGDRPDSNESYYPQGLYSKSITRGLKYFYEWDQLTDVVKAWPIGTVLIGTR